MGESKIGGKQRDHVDFEKKVGLFECKVIAINPTAEEYKDLLGMELKEDSKADEYLGESSEGNTVLRVNVWLEAISNQQKFPVTFFLENKERENKDMTKKQYINSVGSCSWADDPNNLPEWFVKRDYRVAFTGEEDLYNFLRTWLGELDYRSSETTLELDWKKLMKGNAQDIRDLIGCEWCSTFVAEATVITKEKDGETKEYQGVYNKAFLPAYSLRHFRLVDYTDPKIIESISKKKPKDQKPHEKFVLQITGEHGCKDFFILKEFRDYDANENLVASDKPISEKGSDY